MKYDLSFFFDALKIIKDNKDFFKNADISNIGEKIEKQLKT